MIASPLSPESPPAAPTLYVYRTPARRPGWLAAAAVCAVVLAPAPAFPCSRGGSGGGGGSSGGGGGHGGGASATACVDTTPIVGRAECTRFGAWDVARKPRVQGSVGVSMHMRPAADLRFAGVAEHDAPIVFGVAGEEMTRSGELVTATLDLRVAFPVGAYGYIGGELQVGAGTLPGSRSVADAGLALDPGRVLHIGGGVIAGLSVPITSRTAIGAEALAGADYLSVDMISRHDDCVSDAFATVSRWRVSPRLTARRWLTPWLSVNASVGTDLTSGGTSMGVGITSHARAWDGARHR